MARPEDVRLGQLLIRKRWCTLQEVNSGLGLQDQLKEEGKSRSLGWILVRESTIDAEKLKMALSELGMLRLSCPSCQREQPVSRYDPQKSYTCPRCDDVLVLDESSGAGSFLETRSAAVRNRRNADQHDSSGSELPSVADNFDIGAGEVNEDAIVGKVVGGCRVLERLASGGMGVVYKAKQLKLSRVVAVKVLSEELARDRKYVHRFLQEAQSAAELNHGNIVHIIDVGEINGLFYIIMEYVDGSNLREILDTERFLPAERVIEIALQASQALNHAHKRGIIHRDIKPENIMITREGIVKIADLGLAKKLQPDAQDGGITQTKAIMGTPFYMGPEQIKDFRQVDGRTDIYSLGVTMYRALTGAVPFEGRTPVEVMIRVVEGKYPPMRSLRPDVPPDLEEVVGPMMNRSPDDRQQSFAEVLSDLDRVLLGLKSGQNDSVVVTAD